jgi:hypothetical protein
MLDSISNSTQNNPHTAPAVPTLVLQRGLSISTLYTGANPLLIYCYLSTAEDAVQERLWSTIQPQGWISASPIRNTVFYYIPEHLLAWCLLIDSSLRAHPARDYIV